MRHLDYPLNLRNYILISTRLERDRHKKLVEELRRKSNGENGLVIYNGNIVLRCSHHDPVENNAPENWLPLAF